MVCKEKPEESGVEGEGDRERERDRDRKRRGGREGGGKEGNKGGEGREGIQRGKGEGGRWEEEDKQSDRQTGADVRTKEEGKIEKRKKKDR